MKGRLWCSRHLRGGFAAGSQAVCQRHAEASAGACAAPRLGRGGAGRRFLADDLVLATGVGFNPWHHGERSPSSPCQWLIQGPADPAGDLVGQASRVDSVCVLESLWDKNWRSRVKLLDSGNQTARWIIFYGFLSKGMGSTIFQPAMFNDHRLHRRSQPEVWYLRDSPHSNRQTYPRYSMYVR